MKKTILLTGAILFLNILLGGSIGCNAGEGVAEGVIILENGSYFNGNIFVPFKEMILKAGKISSIQSSASKTKGKRVSLNGKYLIPGLIDAHVHIGGCPTFPYVENDPKLNTNSSLICGVTTVIDLFYEENKCKDLKQETGKFPQNYSSLLMAGPILTAPGGHGTEYGVPTRTMTSVEEAKKITNEVIDGGADVIKLVYQASPTPYISSITKEMVQAIVVTAHSRHKKVFAHIDNAAQAIDCAEVGVDVLAHMPADKLTEDQLNKLKASGIIIIPTITVLQSVIEGHDAKYMSDSLLWETANPVFMSNFSHDAVPSPLPDEKIRKYYPSVGFHENLSNCIKMKIPILAGTDAGNYAVFYGYSLHNEMLQYSLAGMTNAEALCAATQNIKLVFPDIKIGEIEVGYDADLVVLNADPLKNIGNAKDINMVFHKGAIAKNLIATLPKETNASATTDTKPMAFDPTALNIPNAATLPSYISTYTDNAMGGSSEINAKLQKDASGNSYVHLNGKVVKKGYAGFASLSFVLSMQKDVLPVDISGFNAIEFDTKGNGEEYVLLFLSSLVKDYNFHAAPFVTSKDWQTIKIPFSDLKQNQYYGKQIPLDLKTIKVISFSASGKDYDIDFDLRNIHLVK